jgi:CRISPR/Cas system CMR-associated protein Cmr1 (group 7 of RAMP superfamily)
MYQNEIIPHDLNFPVKILLILTYDFGSVDQIMNSSLFYMMWVVGLGVRINKILILKLR